MLRFAPSLIIAILAVSAGYLGWRGVLVLNQGYNWAEMDWDGDGSTSLLEVLEASDIGARDVSLGTRECREYFAYKNGQPVRVDCEVD
ncbi:hypothetical protein ACFSM5_05140 [Lacibacterium aquatile]|uniref:EF-hand domain-containing protein n=1 Tax=Lacibacterium aquatile TaxID=1168082 RepID=A0ABW5DNZ2_9PROT